MNTENLAPEIEKLARHFNVPESQAVEAYGHIMLIINKEQELTFETCRSFINGMISKPVHTLNESEQRIGLCLKLLKIKQKPFLNENKTGRNDRCPCGSGAKYKNCCLNRVHENVFKVTK